MRYWTDALTITSGCTKVSPACLHCWAETNHNRFLKHANKKYDHDFSEVRVHPENIENLQKKGKPKVFAVWNDALHSAVSFQTFDLLLSAMIGNPNTLLICTKRPERIEEYFNRFSPIDVPLDNVYFATTIENQEMADLRLPYLRDLPFKTFLSVEPMLSPIYIPPSILKRQRVVIAGCESGPHARETKEWIDDLKDQCVKTGVPLWVKQLRSGYKKEIIYNHPLSTIKREDLWK